MRRKYLSLALLLLAACSKEKDPEMKAPVITGILYRDDVATAMGQYGTPDVYLGGVDPNRNDAEVQMYPNPVKQTLHIWVKPRVADTMRVFVVPARFVNPPAGAVIANTHLFANADTVADHTFPLQTSSSLALDVRSFPAGFYRVYFQTRTKLYYDNMQVMK